MQVIRCLMGLLLVACLTVSATQVAAQAVAQTTEICNNGIDDDGDRLVDCQDPDCPECVRFESCVQVNTCYMPPVWGIPNATGSAVYGAQDLVLATNAPFTTVTIRTADGSFVQTVGVTSSAATTVPLPLSVVFSDQPNTKQRSKGLIITSSEPVQATYRQTPSLNQDIVPLKCRAALGYAFYAGSQTRLGGANIPSERHFISVMATLDGTTVTIRSPIALEGYPANTPFTITLNAGETYMVTSRLINSGGNSENLSVAGTLITSDPDHPIVVNSGSQHTVQPYSGNRDAGIDQLVPARTTGTDYVAVHSLNTTNNSDYVFVVAIENNTTVTISGPTTTAGTSSVLSTTTLQAGQVFTYNLPNAAQNRAFYIRTSKKTYAYHVSSYGQNEFGMGLLPTINPCNGSQRIDFYRTTSSSNDQAIVTIPTSGTPSLTFRGQPFSTFGTVVDQITINGLPHSIVSFPNSAIAAAGVVNTVQSTERFHVGVVSNTGGASTGNYGYYSNYEARVEVINPQTSQPDDFITAGEVTLGVPTNYCLTLTSCGTTNTIKSVQPGRYTQAVGVNSLTCISYTMSTTAPICARDTIRAIVQNELGRETQVCLEFVNRNNDLIVNTLTASPVICQPGGTTSMTVVAISSGRQYTYQWITPDKQVQSTSVVVGAQPGRYLISVGDGNRCIDTTSIVLRADTPALGLTGTSASSSSFCAGATVPYALTSTAGTYAWSLTNGTILSGGTPTSQTATVRWAGPGTGTLRVVVTSPNGCTAALTRTVQLQAAPVLSFSVQNAACFGQANGSISLTTTGSTTPYTYRWTNGSTTEDLTNVPSGPYSVTVTDRGGCVSSGSAVVGQPTALSVVPTVTNVLCNGANSGAISLSVAGGTSGYRYAWSTGEQTPTVASLRAGTYAVTVTDANGCGQSLTVVVTQPSALSANPALQPVLCNGANSGSIGLAPTGGVGPYTYLWATPIGGPVANGQNLGTLPAGAYSVTITDANNCTLQQAFTLSQPPALSITATGQNPTCEGSANGQIDLTATGGVGTYLYRWTGGATTQDVSALVAGTYSVTVTDANGCTATTQTTLTQPPALNLTSTQQNVGCFGETTGSISLMAQGGTAPYAYRWADGSTASTRNGLPTGVYSLTLTDANTCSLVRSFTLTQPPALSLTAFPQNPICFGATDGSISLSVAGGTTPYTYLWTGSIANGTTTEDLTNVPSGTYRVSVTDANGCSQTLTATLTAPPALSLSSSRINVACHEANTGSIDLTATGGVGTYLYRWTNGATTQDIGALVAGTYSVTVTDANGCTATTQNTITQPPALTLTTTPLPVACAGGSNGGVAVTAQGGTAPYGFLWTGPMANGTTSQSLSAVAAGVYGLTVTDGNGCQSSTSVVIGQPTALSLTATAQAIGCFGAATGQIIPTPLGGTLPYTYRWNGPGIAGETTPNQTGLTAGTYSLTLTDANGCTLSLGQSLTQPAALTATQSHTSVSCHSGTDGQIELAVSGGAGPYTFQWNTGLVETHPYASRLRQQPAGTYSVTITDAKGCGLTESVALTEPLPLTVVPQPSDVLCNGQFASIVTDTRGGTGIYTYLWSNGATTPSVFNLPAGTYSLVVTDANTCTATTSATIVQPPPFGIAASVTAVACNRGATGAIKLIVEGATPPYGFTILNSASAVVGSTTLTTGLPADTYLIVVLDNNGCEQTVSINITEPPAITLATTTSHVLCFGNQSGQISLTATGGSTPFAYAWTDGPTTPNRTDLAAGPYSITVTDANGCTVAATTSVTQPPQLTLGLSTTDVSCFGGANGAAEALPNGGTLPYTYQWAGPGIASAQTQRLASLQASIYSVTVTDANGCVQEQRGLIDQPIALTTAAFPKNLTCFQDNTGEIELTVAGGFSPYAVNWNDGNTGQNRTSLAAGVYSVTVTDANGCTDLRSVTLTQPDQLTLATAVQHLTCFGNNTGQISLTATGGTEPRTYLWAGPTNSGSTNQNRANLAAGVYSATVTDQNQCTAQQSVTLTEPQPLTSIIDSQSITCFGTTTGQISLTAQGGTLPYAYTWTNGGSATPDRVNVGAGTYQVVVTDANGCQTSNGLTLTQPPALALSLAASPALCSGSSNGSVVATATGGVGPYTYRWATGAVETQPAGVPVSLTALSAGVYSVTLTDANGCTAIESTTVTQPTTLTVSGSQEAIACFGGNTGRAAVAVAGGSAPYTYLWTTPTGTGATDNAIADLTAGVYSATVTDANGCFEVASFTLTQPPALSLIPATVNVGCFGGTDGTASLTATGGVGPYSFAWSSGATSASLMSLPAGAYSVTATDANGCAQPTSLTLTEPTPLSVTATSTNLSCFTSLNGTISLTAFGGTGPYAYEWTGPDGAPLPPAASLTALPAGTYQVVVTDANGCRAVLSRTLTQPDRLQMELGLAAVSCQGGTDGAVSVVVTGGTPLAVGQPYIYAWSNGAGTSAVAGLSVGVYSVTATDANGCSVVGSETLTQPTGLSISGLVTAVRCFGGNTGTLSVSAMGGVPLYRYAWTDGPTTQTRLDLPAGTYRVTVTDANGCAQTALYLVTEPPRLTLQNSVTNVRCNGGTDGVIAALVSGGTPSTPDRPYSYTWVNSNGPLSDLPVQNSLAAGTYQVRVSDANGCSAGTDINLRQPEFDVFGAATAPNCAGPVARPDGQLRLSTISPAWRFAVSEGSSFTTVIGDPSTLPTIPSDGLLVSNLPNPAAATGQPYTVRVFNTEGCSKDLVLTLPQAVCGCNPIPVCVPVAARKTR